MANRRLNFMEKASVLTEEEEEIPKQRQVKPTIFVISALNKLFKHYSSWHRLISAVGWLSMFVCYIRAKKKLPRHLSVMELTITEISVS